MIYLIGSSIIKKWKFPLECFNLGIGGLLTSDLHQVDISNINNGDSIVFYCGGNDIRKNFSVDTIYQNIVNFFSKIICQDIYILSIVKCKKIYEINRNLDVDKLNKMIENFCSQHGYNYIESNLIFDYCSLNSECKLCRDDGIHLEDEGYEQLEWLIVNCKN